VFSKEESKQYPPKQAWDHAIELKEGSPDAVDCKVYPLSQTEDVAVQEFVKNKLEKGYIHISNHHTHHPSSSYTRKTANYDRYKITEKSMPSWYETNTHFPSSWTSYVI